MGKEDPAIAGHVVYPWMSKTTVLKNSHHDLVSQSQLFMDRRIQCFRLIVSIAPGISKVLTAIVPCSSPLHSWIADIELIIDILPPLSGSHTSVLSSSWPFYNCTIIHVLYAINWPHGALNEVNRLVFQLIFRLRGLNNGISRNGLYAVIAMTSASGWLTGAMRSI
jgi:hypothetical protein